MRIPCYRPLLVAASLWLLAASASAHSSRPHLLTPGASYFSFGYSSPIIHRRGYHHRPSYGRRDIVAPRRYYNTPHYAPRFGYQHRHRPYFRRHSFGHRFGAPGLQFYYRH